MIHLLDSDLPGFKRLQFKPGLNVLLTDKSAGATDKQTRNGAGKSSLLELIHFLLGSSCSKDSIFRNDALKDAVFSMEFDLAGAFTRVERCGAKSSQITVAGGPSGWPLLPTAKDGQGTVKANAWKSSLGKLMFGLGEAEGKWSPSFRSMVSYFVRREGSGGMNEPMKSSGKQRLVDQQVSVSSLIGLDWQVPRQWQAVRDREATLKELKKGMADGVLGSVVGEAARIKSELIIAEDRARRLALVASSFKVLDEYEHIEREASQLTQQIAALADENVLDRRYLDELKASSAEDVPAVASDIEALFREAQTILPDLVRQRFDEAQAFHDSVVRNRRLYLESEVVAASRRIQDREEEYARLDGRRAEVMQLLASAGALEHFVDLQGESARAEAKAETLRQRYAAAEALESGQNKLKRDRADLSQQLRRGYKERESVIEEAVLVFRQISVDLYGEQKAGSLTISPTDNGPLFEPHLPAEKSKGVNNMRIFCFDMMLMVLSLRRGHSPGFLIHDSHLFDGVDERQVGSALAVGAALAEQHSFQYVVTMNSDALPQAWPAGFAIENYVLPLRLTDATEDGGLFGLRFE